MHKYTNRFYQLLDEMKSLHDKKRHDYAQEADPFANFRLSELGGIDAWKGIAVRLGDKYSRLMSFIDKGELKFKEENIKDTFLDTAIYSLIGLILYEESREKSKTGDQPEDFTFTLGDKTYDQTGQCLLFPDQQHAEYNTMVGVDTAPDMLTEPASNFNKRMYKHHKEHGTDMSFENEKEPKTRLEQMANLKYDPVAPE